MQARTTSAHLLEAFLLLEQPRQRLSHWTQSLAPLDDEHAPPLAGITAYYDPETDQALLGLRYDEIALGENKLAYVVDVARVYALAAGETLLVLPQGGPP